MDSGVGVGSQERGRWCLEGCGIRGDLLEVSVRNQDGGRDAVLEMEPQRG